MIHPKTTFASRLDVFGTHFSSTGHPQLALLRATNSVCVRVTEGRQIGRSRPGDSSSTNPLTSRINRSLWPSGLEIFLKKNALHSKSMLECKLHQHKENKGDQNFNSRKFIKPRCTHSTENNTQQGESMYQQQRDSMNEPGRKRPNALISHRFNP